MMGIYRIRNTENGKAYIGSSRYVEGRFRQHKQLLRRNLHYSIHLQRAWGLNPMAFVFEVVEECDEDSLVSREQFYIDKEHPIYNILPQAGNHSPRPKETRKRIGASNRLAALKSPLLRRQRSERAKSQHQEGTLGRRSWKPETEGLVREKLKASWSIERHLKPCYVCGTRGWVVRVENRYYCLPHDPVPGRNEIRNEKRRQAQLRITNRVMTEATKAKISASNLGKKHNMTPEGRAALSASAKRRSLKSHWNGHYPLGKDTREIRETLHGWGDLAESMRECLPPGL